MMDINVLDLTIQCLVNIGSTVPNVTEMFYRKYIEPLGKTLNPTCHLQVKAANGLAIPHVGYIEIQC